MARVAELHVKVLRIVAGIAATEGADRLSGVVHRRSPLGSRPFTRSKQHAAALAGMRPGKTTQASEARSRNVRRPLAMVPRRPDLSLESAC